MLYLFILFLYLWLCWVFVSVLGLSPAVASGGHSSSRCAGLLLSRPLLLRSTGSRRACSAIVAHGPSRSAAHGILPDQGPNPRPLHWQADSQPLRHQGSPRTVLLNALNHNNAMVLRTVSFTHCLIWSCKQPWKRVEPIISPFGIWRWRRWRYKEVVLIQNFFTGTRWQFLWFLFSLSTESLLAI